MDYDVIVAGGRNTHFSSAIFRIVFNHVDELDRFIPDAEDKYPGFFDQPMAACLLRA